MFRIFHANAHAFQGTMHNPQWKYVREGLVRNLTTVQNFYNNHSMAVSSQHFLLKILLHYGASSQIDVREFYRYVSSSSLNLSMALKMTSSIYTGKVFEGVFYGPGINEVLIAHNDVFDPVEAYQNWMNLQPIQILSHPINDLSVPILNGTNAYNAQGLAVIAINIPLLVLMYRGFRDNEQSLIQSDEESQRSVMQFIHMFVLPSMNASHLDFAVFNRLKAKLLDDANHKGNVKHSFYLTDYSNMVDSLQTEVANVLRGKRLSFGAMLQNMKVVTQDSMLETVVYPEMAPTRQVAWALIVAALPVLEALFHLESLHTQRQNQTIINQIQKRLKFYRSDQLIESALNRTLAQSIKNRLAALEAF